ncbi:transcriptional regulator [Bradyrhizobium sp. 83012]|uniref:Transcriptional regulator n=1 Tax=Bradyrhizobium aeschynomenes TaxID=2734909 RepID=A0ABX2CMT8_9BRAD|nr:transcriptional regulator [Bradyrhizobium aeschynomenes]NPU14399.1 transcriptional regulator [Bradyrhizobium aeschynomenes]NPU69458.1 transcriptional regulator [Bradyrhizobium aeschynomenes]NPV20451.1 transcriptional regulator [Bradyrhizobium aeschynomenes]
MATKKTSERSPESMARAERQRVAAEDGAKARAEWDQRAVAVRKNMERLRVLRLAKEAEAAQAPPDAAPKRRKKVAR